MSVAQVHADNSAQVEYWNAKAGQKWPDRQEHQDQVLRPVSDRLLAAAGEARRARDRCRLRLRRDHDRLRGARRSRRRGSRARCLRADAGPRPRARAPGPAVPLALADATVHVRAPMPPTSSVSRFGVMFFADPAKSFANLRQGLKPGGRLVFACWREPKQNPWLILPLREAGKHAPPLPETDPEDPGPFAFASEARVRRILERGRLRRHRARAARPRARHRRR